MLIPFFAFALGATLNLKLVWTAGLVGLALGAGVLLVSRHGPRRCGSIEWRQRHGGHRGIEQPLETPQQFRPWSPRPIQNTQRQPPRHPSGRMQRDRDGNCGRLSSPRGWFSRINPRREKLAGISEKLGTWQNW